MPLTVISTLRVPTILESEVPNGLVRQYIPKGANFDEVTVEFIGQVAESLNNRPRRRYGFSTPLERFSELTGLPAEKFF